VTVATDVSSVDYVGNGVTTAFAVPFPFLANAHLVLTRTVDEVDTVLTEGVDYTLTGAGGASGTATLTEPLASGAGLNIERNVPLTQETAFTAQGTFSPALHERALDKLTMMVQQLSRCCAPLQASVAAVEAAVSAIEADVAELETAEPEEEPAIIRRYLMNSAHSFDEEDTPPPTPGAGVARVDGLTPDIVWSELSPRATSATNPENQQTLTGNPWPVTTAGFGSAATYVAPIATAGNFGGSGKPVTVRWRAMRGGNTVYNTYVIAYLWRPSTGTLLAFEPSTATLPPPKALTDDPIYITAQTCTATFYNPIAVEVGDLLCIEFRAMFTAGAIAADNLRLYVGTADDFIEYTEPVP
jgi:hypothetical protein